MDPGWVSQVVDGVKDSTLAQVHDRLASLPGNVLAVIADTDGGVYFGFKVGQRLLAYDPVTDTVEFWPPPWALDRADQIAVGYLDDHGDPIPSQPHTSTAQSENTGGNEGSGPASAADAATNPVAGFIRQFKDSGWPPTGDWPADPRVLAVNMLEVIYGRAIVPDDPRIWDARGNQELWTITGAAPDVPVIPSEVAETLRYRGLTAAIGVDAATKVLGRDATLVLGPGSSAVVILAPNRIGVVLDAGDGVYLYDPQHRTFSLSPPALADGKPVWAAGYLDAHGDPVRRYDPELEDEWDDAENSGVVRLLTQPDVCVGLAHCLHQRRRVTSVEARACAVQHFEAIHQKWPRWTRKLEAQYARRLVTEAGWRDDYEGHADGLAHYAREVLLAFAAGEQGGDDGRGPGRGSPRGDGGDGSVGGREDGLPGGRQVSSSGQEDPSQTAPPESPHQPTRANTPKRRIPDSLGHTEPAK